MKICKHQEWLINQGVHWCGLQNPIYPDCKNCPNFEELDVSGIYTSTAINYNIDEISSSKIGFWKADKPYGEFSNWYACEFEYMGIKFSSSEQALMWTKANVFQDSTIAELILVTNNQKRIKELGRAVKNYDDNIWSRNRYNIMIDILYAKFSQNSNLMDKLLITGKAELFEASPYDKIWGIGSSDVNIINGENLLGKALMEVRSKLSLVRAYSKINNLCCLSSNRYKDFFQDYNGTDEDICKDVNDMIGSLEQIKQAIDELNTIKKGD